MPRSKAKEQEQELRQTSGIAKFKVYLKALGPGLITGTSDDDPAGIGTYAQTGARLGYSDGDVGGRHRFVDHTGFWVIEP